MLELLKDRVYNANQDLQEQSGCEFSWISVSAIDREQGLVVMMPDGGALEPEDMTVLDLEGNLVEGKEPPVCDTAVHLQLYREFPEVGSIAHPYSRWATVFAQLDMSIPTLGTIHARTFSADIPAAQQLPDQDLCDLGCTMVARAIAQTYREKGFSPLEVPAILVACQGAYTFGKDSRSAVHHAKVLDEAAFLAYHTIQLDPGIRSLGYRKNRK